MAQKTTSRGQSAAKNTKTVKASNAKKSSGSPKKSAPVSRKPVSGKEKNMDMLSKTRVQLLEEAKSAGLTGISRLTKEQLVKSLSKKRK